MPYYKYAKLNMEHQEIRLVTLLPGEIDDPIPFNISHRLFNADSNNHEQPSTKITKKIRSTLPPEWLVLETVEGRLIYNYTDEEGNGCSSWTHPDPNIEAEISEQSLARGSEILNSEFEALSYTWGSTDHLEDGFVINSVTSDSVQPIMSTLPLTTNLASALRHIRSVSKTRILWIDAICINQKDFEERGQQVQRMGSIYKSASRVLAWLGPSTQSTKLAISTLEDLGSLIEFTRNDCILPPPG